MAEAAIYFQNYSKAINCLEKARKIEPFFCRNKLPNLLEYLSHFASEVAKLKKSLLNRKNAEEIHKSLNDAYDELQLRKKDGVMDEDGKISWFSKNPPKRKISEIKETNAEGNESFVAVLRVLTQINTNSFTVP
uniref:Uncharacterized protein n=1 Tax=Panagrolaimus sp. ES5 TaxID=591445 RepID=A0AC34GLU0_9BILA